MKTILVVDLLENIVEFFHNDYSSETFQHGPVVCILYLNKVQCTTLFNKEARDCGFTSIEAILACNNF